KIEGVTIHQTVLIHIGLVERDKENHRFAGNGSNIKVYRRGKAGFGNGNNNALTGLGTGREGSRKREDKKINGVTSYVKNFLMCSGSQREVLDIRVESPVRAMSPASDESGRGGRRITMSAITSRVEPIRKSRRRFEVYMAPTCSRLLQWHNRGYYACNYNMAHDNPSAIPPPPLSSSASVPHERQRKTSERQRKPTSGSVNGPSAA
ncbi:hypothetical protein AGABI1DRAFT_96044, partial [Agaricus bisporus var. burnettii JB137-S8]